MSFFTQIDIHCVEDNAHLVAVRDPAVDILMVLAGRVTLGQEVFALDVGPPIGFLTIPPMAQESLYGALGDRSRVRSRRELLPRDRLVGIVLFPYDCFIPVY